MVKVTWWGADPSPAARNTFGGEARWPNAPMGLEDRVLARWRRVLAVAATRRAGSLA